MIDKSVEWIRKNTVPKSGIVVSHKQRHPYPEVSGYYIPTLINIGERDLAKQYANYLVTIQNPNGSFFGGWGGREYVFDTAQIVRGWVSIVDIMPELKEPIRKACDWLVREAQPSYNKLYYGWAEHKDKAWAMMLYALWPIKQANDKLFNDDKITQCIDEMIDLYISEIDIHIRYDGGDYQAHYYMYAMEALYDFGYEDYAKKGLEDILTYRNKEGWIPGKSYDKWICYCGNAQAALLLARMKDQRAAHLIELLETVQTKSGGFYGSNDTQYFSTEEISWTTKYYVDAVLEKSQLFFEDSGDLNAQIYLDPRITTIINSVKNLKGKLLDLGCGKGAYLKALKKHRPDLEVVGMDIAPFDDTIIQGTLLNTSFDDEEFDIVICNEAFEHSLLPENCLKELNRITKTEGTIFILDKNGKYFEHNKQIGLPQWERWFTGKEIEDMGSMMDLQVSYEDVDVTSLYNAGMFTQRIPNIDNATDFFMLWTIKKEIKTYRGDIYKFISKIKDKENFSLVRFGDGEIRPMIYPEQSMHGGGYDWHYDPSETQFTDDLIEALSYKSSTHHCGILCPHCNTNNGRFTKEQGKEYFNMQKKLSGKPDKELSFCDIFTNSNHSIFLKDMVPLFNERNIVMVFNETGNINNLPFSVKKSFNVKKDAYQNSYHLIDDITNYLKDKSDYVVLVAAGPFANVLVTKLAMNNKDNTYIDIGSTLDPQLGLGKTRGYLNNAGDINESCHWEYD